MYADRGMYWRDTESVPGQKTGLTLVVPEPRHAGLVLESSRSGRLRLRAGAEPILWARMEKDYAGIWMLRRDTLESPRIVEPIRAREARARTTMGDWMRHFAGELERSARSPLVCGTWHLAELRPAPTPAGSSSLRVAFHLPPPGGPPAARGLARALAQPRLKFHRWSVSAPGDVVPVRTFNDSGSARVKAYRKLAREGMLPPILLWYVRGLEAPLLIDGHDRLSAAMAEKITPRVLALWQSAERVDDGSKIWPTRAVTAYERAHERADRLSDATRRNLNEKLIRAFCIPTRARITTARAKPGLDEVWMAEVSAELAGDSSDEAWEMLHGGAA